MILPATQDLPRGWGFGRTPPPVVVVPKVKREPMHIIQAREFDRRKSQVLLLLNNRDMSQNEIREAMDWPTGSTWRVLTRLMDTGQIDRTRTAAGCVYALRRIA